MRYPWYATDHVMLFFPTITMEIRAFHFKTSMVKMGNFSNLSIKLYRTYERGLVVTDITMGCDVSIKCDFPN